MDKQFWIKAWQEGKTAFHQMDFNSKLIQYFPLLKAKKGERVFVPLCGKTHDMLYLLQQGLKVEGVELFETAVKEFFKENSLPTPRVEKDQSFVHYRLDHITVSSGDFFSVDENHPFDFIYDRASLVALPHSMRKSYAEKITRLLKDQGRCLLITYQYNQNEMDGPPFSLSDEEIQELYGSSFSIQELEGEKPQLEGSRLSQVPSLLQKVYLLTKQSR